MEATIQYFNIALPVNETGFLRTLSKKMGWTIQRAKSAMAAVKEETHSPLYCELQSAFRDVKLMMDGKKPEKSIDDLIYELRNTNN
jgi:nitrate/nitrite-specific signal transduction histidine kinase